VSDDGCYTEYGYGSWYLIVLVVWIFFFWKVYFLWTGGGLGSDGDMYL